MSRLETQYMGKVQVKKQVGEEDDCYLLPNSINIVNKDGASEMKCRDEQISPFSFL